MRWRVSIRVLLLPVVASAAVSAATAGTGPAAASVDPKVVPEDTYPPRHVGFPDGVVGTPDLVYATWPGFRPLHLDLYQPRDRQKSAPHPFVVYVHGGGWQGGHTRQSGAFTSWPTVLATLAARGYVVASVEYRLSGEAAFPAAIQDIKAAIRWLRAHAAEYEIDAARGAVWGASAGGQLAALAATSCGVSELEPPPATGPAPEPGRAQSTQQSLAPRPAAQTSAAAQPSDCVQAAITWYGIFDFSSLAAQRGSAANAPQGAPPSAESRYLGCNLTACPQRVIAAASPITYVGRDLPPMLLIHGSSDKTVPVQQSQEMFERLQAAGAPVQMLLIPDVDHSFIGATPEQTQKASRAALTRVFEFIDQTVGGGSK